MLIYLQDAPVDVAALYRGDAWNWGGIFHEDGRPGKPYYAWMAFKRLIEESEQRVRVHAEGGKLAVAAGLASRGVIVPVSNYGGERYEYS